MFSFFKKKVLEPVPEWAFFLDGKQYAAFLSGVDSYFKKKDLQYELSDGAVNVNEKIFGSGKLGLTNVAQICRQSKLNEYNKIITRHFDSMVQSHQFDQEFEKIAHDFEKVKQYIGVRLYDNDYVAYIGKELTMGKDIAGDIYAMLVFDLPHSVVSMAPSRAEEWGKGLEELFAWGIKNMKERYPPKISQYQFNEFKVWLAQGNHFFAPNIIFDLINRKELIGSKGSLIGLPHRHAVLIYPIETMEAIKAVNQLIPTIYGMHQEGPGSLSNNLLWYKDGEFTNLPYKLEDEKLQFIPPDNFVEMLNTLR